MTHKKLNLIIGSIVFLTSLFVLTITTQSDIPFWDCGESSAAATLLQVPHPPGSPFHALVGRIFSMIPVSNNAFRINFLSTLSSAITVSLIYFSCVILIILLRGLPKNLFDKLIVYGSSAIGALAFSFSDSFWFISVESTHFSQSLSLLVLVVWLALHWYTVHDTIERGEKYFILIAFLFGIAIGVHQLSLLAFFTVALIYYFKKYEVTVKSFVSFSAITVAIFVFIYKGILMGVPYLLGSSDHRIIFFLLMALLFYGIWYSYKHKLGFVNLALLSIFFIVIGYSTYTMIVIRANKGLALNENNPNSFDRLVPYLAREQYGDWPVVNFDKTKYGGKLFPRRWTEEDYRVARFKEYKSDWDYFVRYQFYNMWFRYLLWNYVGRAGDVQDSPPAFLGNVDPSLSVGQAGKFPKKYFAIPFIIGLIGALYHLWKDKKMGFVIWGLFIVTGFGLMFYQNMQNPQPRERDYFFVGSFYVYAIWIGLGIAAILEFMGKSMKSLNYKKFAGIGFISLAAVAIPGNMLYQNYSNHNRNGNYLPWDLSYNLLQSCPKDAILFTAGDNDTFPVWYLQDAEGIRRDVRLVNLSLINTDWYPLQMKNETPYGAKKVPMNYSDDEILQITRRFNEWGKSKIIDLPVSNEIYKRFLDEELNTPKEFASLLNLSNSNNQDFSKNPEKVSFTINSTFSVPDQNGQQHYGLRTQDLLMLDIVKSNNWERPICYSVTVPPSMRIGLDQYLKLEGLSYRLTPFKLNIQNDFINAQVTYDHLIKEPEGFSKEPQIGMKFRNLNNPNLYLDENGMRSAQDYRFMFTSLARYFGIHLKDKQKALEILSIMQKKIPDNVVRLELRSKYSMLYLYRMLDATDEVKNMAIKIEKECLDEIAMNPTNTDSETNPYNILIDVYEVTQEYDKEIGIFKKLAVLYPQDVSIKNRIDQLNTLKNNPKLDSTKK